jgi:Protein of unknown function (DUF3098)
MSDKKKQAEDSPVTKAAPAAKAGVGSLFGKENYKWMIIGLAVAALGMILMAGGKSSNPNEFNPEEVYSTTRITIAPLLIVIGLGIEIFAIFRKPKTA